VPDIRIRAAIPLHVESDPGDVPDRNELLSLLWVAVRGENYARVIDPAQKEVPRIETANGPSNHAKIAGR
jgi:hypothetical protein